MQFLIRVRTRRRSRSLSCCRRSGDLRREHQGVFPAATCPTLRYSHHCSRTQFTAKRCPQEALPAGRGWSARGGSCCSNLIRLRIDLGADRRTRSSRLACQRFLSFRCSDASTLASRRSAARLSDPPAASPPGRGSSEEDSGMQERSGSRSAQPRAGFIRQCVSPYMLSASTVESCDRYSASCDRRGSSAGGCRGGRVRRVQELGGPLAARRPFGDQAPLGPVRADEPAAGRVSDTHSAQLGETERALRETTSLSEPARAPSPSDAALRSVSPH